MRSYVGSSFGVNVPAHQEYPKIWGMNDVSRIKSWTSETKRSTVWMVNNYDKYNSQGLSGNKAMVAVYGFFSRENGRGLSGINPHHGESAAYMLLAPR